MAQTDYCLTNMQAVRQSTVQFPEVLKLDHRMLITDVVLHHPKLPAQDQQPIGIHQQVPLKQLSVQELGQIILHKDWPRRPFNLIAKSYGLTNTINITKTKKPQLNKML